MPAGVTRWALAYWVVFNSCVAYLLLTFGNKHADASIVLAYVAVQPLTAVMWSWLLNYIPALKKYHLAQPGWNFLGALGVLGGLACIVYDAARADRAKRQLGGSGAGGSTSSVSAAAGTLQQAAAASPTRRGGW
eukprot:COSAG01_NODE_16290_length_1250_cov_1.406603_1_plen_134_part_00